MRWKDFDLGVVCVNKLCMGVACLQAPSAADVSGAISKLPTCICASLIVTKLQSQYYSMFDIMTAN